jgi:hypothetical protein
LSDCDLQITQIQNFCGLIHLRQNKKSPHTHSSFEWCVCRLQFYFYVVLKNFV